MGQVWQEGAEPKRTRGWMRPSGRVGAAQPGAEQGEVSVLLLLDTTEGLGVSCYRLVRHSERFPCGAHQKLGGFQLNREKTGKVNPVLTQGLTDKLSAPVTSQRFPVCSADEDDNVILIPCSAVIHALATLDFGDCLRKMR